jgi:2-hydroxy-6-oxonona-2,4-dienedioate hydrolase
VSRSPLLGSVWAGLMHTEFEQGYLMSDGVRTRFLAAGSGEPLVLLHSGGGFAEAYARNIAAHARHFRVYVPDLLGCGLTGRARPTYTLDDLLEFVSGFQDAIGAARICLSGCSVGAWVAALYAAAHPARVRRLVLTCGVPLRPGDVGVQQFIERCEKEAAAATEQELRSVSRGTFLDLFSRPEDVSDELAELAYQLNWRPERADGTRAMITGLLSEMIFPTDLSLRRGPQALRSISCPTLLMWARGNPGQSVELAERALSLLQDGRLYICEGSGHWPQWEVPEVYNRAQLDFLLDAPS